MKETIKINLNGQLFDLDKDAYERLQKYISSLEKKFSKTPNESKEIIEDIEARIAELLALKLSASKQVISFVDIEEIINNLGTADDMDSPVEEPTHSKPEPDIEAPQTRKRIFRDIDNSKLGGVSSGLAAYFGIDPLWIRLLFVALVFLHLSGVVIYLVLWIVMPPAKTTAQKLEMQGKPVNVDTIQESVKQEYERVKSGLKNYSRSEEYRNLESTMLRVLRAFGEIFLVLLKVIGALIGLALVIALIGVIVAVFVGGMSLSTIGMFDGWQWPQLLSWQHLTIIGVCLFFVLVIPILAILGKIVRWLFDIPRRNSIAAGVGATIWVIAFISLIVILVIDHDKGIYRYNSKNKASLSTNSVKTLYIDLNSIDTYNKAYDHFQIFDYNFVWDEDKDDLINEVDLEIRRSTDSNSSIELQKEYFKFELDKDADKFLSVANYEWHLTDTLLVLDKYYTCNEKEVWRLPKVKVILSIPENINLQYTDEVAQLITGGIFANDFDIASGANQKLKMTAEGLEIAK